MGLDALVYCDCHELGRMRSAPPTPAKVDDTGALVPSAQNSQEVAAFDRWRADACEHPGGIAVREHLGNVATIAALHEALGRQPKAFPILVERVLYSGSHTGDHLALALLSGLGLELARLADVPDMDAQEQQGLLQFRERLGTIVRVAREVGKPIVF